MHDEHDQHWRRLRAEHERRLDADYAEWRRWRDARRDPPQPTNPGDGDALAPRDEGALESLGRAISETVTGSERAPSGTSAASRP